MTVPELNETLKTVNKYKGIPEELQAHIANHLIEYSAKGVSKARLARELEVSEGYLQKVCYLYDINYGGRTKQADPREKADFLACTPTTKGELVENRFFSIHVMGANPKVLAKGRWSNKAKA